MAMSSSAVVYNLADAQGACRIYYIPQGARYFGVSSEEVFKDLFGWKVDGKVRSIDVHPAADGSGTAAILFGAGEVSAWDNIEGQFVQVHRRNYQTYLNVYTELDPRLTNRYCSLLLVNTGRAGRTQTMQSVAGLIGQIGTPLLAQTDKLAKGLSLTGGPRVRWSWSHNGDNWLQPQRTYARIDISMTYDPSDFFGSFAFGNYQIDISFWLDLWIANGALTGAIVKYHYHVSKGLLAKLVGGFADMAAQLINLQANTILLPPVLSGINAQLAALGRTPTDVFLLPGNQAPSFTLLGNTIFVGNEWDDATLVLETQP